MSKLYHGKMIGIRIGDVLPGVLDHLPSNLTAVVRSVDSSTTCLDITRILTFHGIEHSVVCGNVCLTEGLLRRAVEQGVFTGFDEVWLFAAAPPSSDLGGLPPATSDASDFSVQVPPCLMSNFRDTVCLLLLGDGCGLNYLTMDAEVVRGISSVSPIASEGENMRHREPH
jgi:hypothetical protein